MPVRLTVSGLVARRLVPARKAVGGVLSGKMRLLDLALLVLAGLLYWHLRGEWIDSHARDLALLNSSLPAARWPPLRLSIRWMRSRRPTMPMSPPRIFFQGSQSERDRRSAASAAGKSRSLLFRWPMGS